MRIQRSAEHRVVPWANGVGVTADVFLWPTGAADWVWRLSIADVSDDLPFSYMPGIERHIVVAQGEGMALTIDGAPEQRMDRNTPPLSFAGESTTTCRLLDGPIADLNLMLRRGRATGGLHVVSVPPAMTIRTWPGDVAIVVLDGTVTLGPAALTTFDAVLLLEDPTPPAPPAGRGRRTHPTGPAEPAGPALPPDGPAAPAELPTAELPTAGPAGARVAIATVHPWQPICGTAQLAIARLRDSGTPPPD